MAPEGENLWAGSKGYFTPQAMVDAWIREKKYFRPGTFPDNSVTGRVEDVGHYTQVVWRATNAADWEYLQPIPAGTRATVNVSKDNVIFGVRAVDAAGHRSLAVVPEPER